MSADVELLTVAQRRVREAAEQIPAPELGPTIEEKLADVLVRLKGLERGVAAVVTDMQAMGSAVSLEPAAADTDNE